MNTRSPTILSPESSLSPSVSRKKARIAQAITQAIVSNADCGDDAVSVSIEDVAPADWVEKIYKPDILAHWDRLYKKPGYNPL